MPIPLGVLAVAGAGGGGGAAGNAYEWLETTVLGSNQTTVTFANLNNYSSTYQHLQIRMTARSSRSSNEDHYYLQFNNDTGSNYRSHYLTGTGSSVVSGDPTSSYPSGVFNYFGVTAATSDTSSFGANVIDILDPFETTKNTTVRILSGSTNINRIGLSSGAWFNTNALTEIDITCVVNQFVSGSRFSLYGLRSA